MAAKKRTADDRRNEMFRATVAKYLVLTGYDKSALAVRMRVCPATLYNRLNKPGSLTLDDLRRMMAALGIPAEEAMGFIR
jgi:transposase